jgi:hypothetical protein
MPYRVVLWTTGHVASFAGRAVVDHPNLELVGAYAWSPEKAGRDVGELIGIEPLGITATSDVDELLALEPDVAAHTRAQVGEHVHGWMGFQPLYEEIVRADPDVLS